MYPQVLCTLYICIGDTMRPFPKTTIPLRPPFPYNQACKFTKK